MHGDAKLFEIQVPVTVNVGKVPYSGQHGLWKPRVFEHHGGPVAVEQAVHGLERREDLPSRSAWPANRLLGTHQYLRCSCSVIVSSLTCSIVEYGMGNAGGAQEYGCRGERADCWNKWNLNQENPWFAGLGWSLV